MIGAVPAPDGIDFELPPDLVAQRPLADRDHCRLLCMRRGVTNAVEELRFDAVAGLVARGDLLVRNVSRVLPARLVGRRTGGGHAELLLVEPAAQGAWWALAKPGRKLSTGARVEIAPGVAVVVRAVDAAGRRLVEGSSGDLLHLAQRHGRMPLPPYIDRAADLRDEDDYQTVYARVDGSVAAPTAGLHFTPELLDAIAARGARIADLVLHVGPGTFAPMRTPDPSQHQMHWERFEIPAATQAAIGDARASGARVIAVGTTVLRALESLRRWQTGQSGDDIEIQPAADTSHGRTRLFLYPPAQIDAADVLITNFHLPRSTLLLLVQAFAGIEPVRAAYAHAVASRFRFYSYGDAMWIA